MTTPTDRDICRIAEDIIERSPSFALRVCGDNGMWKTLFITENIKRLGYRRADFMEGRVTWMDVVHPEDLPGLVQKLDEYEVNGQDQYTTVYRILKKNGEAFWITDASTVVRDEKGAVLYSDCIITDYSETKSHIERIRDNYRQQAVLNDILQGLHDSDLKKSLQIILDRVGEYLDISRVILFEDNADHTACKAVYEWCNHGISSMRANGDFILDYEKDIPEVARDLRVAGRQIVNYGDIPANSAREFDNEGVIAAAIYSVQVDDEPYGFICFDECVKRRHWSEDTVRFLENASRLVSPALMRLKNEELIRRMAITDQLTGLYNRRALESRLAGAIEEAGRLGRSGHVLFIDLDDFKIINDSYGHDYGDAMLREFADFLRRHFSDAARIFRFGGDEFVLLLDPGREDQVYQILGALQTRAQLPWQALDREFTCTLSIGIVRFPEADLDAGAIIRNADVAMYQAKRMGKNNYAFYSNSLDNDSLSRADLEREMRSAIDRGYAGFDVLYLPFADRTGGIGGAEALLRWELGDGRKIGPKEFRQLAEYLGLIVPLGEFVLRRAARVARRANQVFPGFFVTINVALRQLRQPDFMQRVLTVLREEGAEGGNIFLEISEAIIGDDLQRLKILAEEFSRHGVKISLDDFGAGSSSLSSLRELPVAAVKIDRTFVNGLSTDRYSRSFVRLITDLVHSMDRKVIAEGVETAGELAYCRDCSVDYVQGFHLWQPMAEEKLRALLESGGQGRGDASK